MTPEQRQFLAKHGFSLKGLDDVQFVLDRLPTAKHDGYITWLTSPRPPFKSTARRMTREEVQKAHAHKRHDFFVLEESELSDAQTRALITEGIRDEVRRQVNAI